MKDATFYLYFANQSDAHKLASLLSAQGFTTDLHTVENEFSLQLKKLVTGIDEVKQIEKNLSGLANEHHGEYDGHELKV